MKNLLGAVAETMRNTELAEAKDVAKKWAKKPLTPMKPKMKDPVAVRGVGVMEKDQATRLFPGVEHVSTRLHKEDVELNESELEESKDHPDIIAIHQHLADKGIPIKREFIRHAYNEFGPDLKKMHKHISSRFPLKRTDLSDAINHANSREAVSESLDVPTPNVEELAKKHGVSLDEILTQLVKGVKIEMEHTTDREVANEIARDHIKEDPKYYDKLAKVEESTDVDKMITFHQQGLANANYKGPMATMHKKKLKELLSTKEKKKSVPTDEISTYFPVL